MVYMIYSIIYICARPIGPSYKKKPFIFKCDSLSSSALSFISCYFFPLALRDHHGWHHDIIMVIIIKEPPRYLEIFSVCIIQKYE